MKIKINKRDFQNIKTLLIDGNITFNKDYNGET
jgi:hypothetical protein